VLVELLVALAVALAAFVPLVALAVAAEGVAVWLIRACTAATW